MAKKKTVVNKTRVDGVRQGYHVTTGDVPAAQEQIPTPPTPISEPAVDASAAVDAAFERFTEASPAAKPANDNKECQFCGAKWSAFINENGRVCARCISHEAWDAATAEIFPHGVPDKLD